MQVFESSGTTGQTRSKHYVPDVNWYHQVSKAIFNQQWGELLGLSHLRYAPLLSGAE